MNKFRLWLGEWLHLLADKVLPIPAYAKSGTYVGKVGDFTLVSGSAIVDGSEVYDVVQRSSCSVDEAKEVMYAEARREVLARILQAVAHEVEWSYVQHGNKDHVYYEVTGRSVIKHTKKE